MRPAHFPVAQVLTVFLKWPEMAYSRFTAPKMAVKGLGFIVLLHRDARPEARQKLTRPEHVPMRLEYDGI